MAKIKIETVRLTVDQELKLGASMRQLTYIKALMAERNMAEQFQQHFTWQGKIIRNHLTIASGTQLIKALLAGKEIVFIVPPRKKYV